MTFHDDLLAALKTDLVAAGVVTTATQVYAGPHRRKVQRTDIEVWLMEVGFQERGGGMQSIREWSHELHVLLNVGPSATGANAAATSGMASKLQGIADRYGGTGQLMSISGVIGSEAKVVPVEVEIDEDHVIEGVVSIKNLVGG